MSQESSLIQFPKSVSQVLTWTPLKIGTVRHFTAESPTSLKRSWVVGGERLLRLCLIGLILYEDLEI